MIAIEHHTSIEQEEVEEEQEQKETEEELQLQGARPSDSRGTNRILPYWKC